MNLSLSVSFEEAIAGLFLWYFKAPFNHFEKTVEQLKKQKKKSFSFGITLKNCLGFQLAPVFLHVHVTKLNVWEIKSM